ncbi:MAG: FKBP-type peptidyl-prolyl cis-trans isomerase [Alphaproteobacteria bacterium]|nr:FKBP-type peptidyl-prolyl cis-trans isomerase [Alphaproteobacteria bacterium]
MMVRISLAAALVLALIGCGEKEPVAVEPAAPVVASEPAAAPAASARRVDATAFTKFVPWPSASPDVIKSGTGMEYVVLASGPDSGVAPTAAQQAEVFYEGRLNADGTTFDSAFDRGESATFPVAAVVPGFSEALQMMKPGDRWLVYIPSELGYGAQGTPGGPIPPDAALVFEIEMVGVK